MLYYCTAKTEEGQIRYKTTNIRHKSSSRYIFGRCFTSRLRLTYVRHSSRKEHMFRIKFSEIKKSTKVFPLLLSARAMCGTVDALSLSLYLHSPRWTQRKCEQRKSHLMTGRPRQHMAYLLRGQMKSRKLPALVQKTFRRLMHMAV